MTGPPWQSAGQRQQQQMQAQARRRMEMGYWVQQQQRQGRPTPHDRLGCFGRLLRWLLGLVLGVASLAAFGIAAFLALNTDYDAAVVFGVTGICLAGAAQAIHRWGRA